MYGHQYTVEEQKFMKEYVSSSSADKSSFVSRSISWNRYSFKSFSVVLVPIVLTSISNQFQEEQTIEKSKNIHGQLMYIVDNPVIQCVNCVCQYCVNNQEGHIFIFTLTITFFYFPSENASFGNYFLVMLHTIRSWLL